MKAAVPFQRVLSELGSTLPLAATVSLLILIGCESSPSAPLPPMIDPVETADTDPAVSDNMIPFPDLIPFDGEPAVDLTDIDGIGGCDGMIVNRRGQKLLELSDGSLITTAKMNINADGAANAYHRQNQEAGAILHLCNAGSVYLPDGTYYHGSESNETCTGKFMDDVARIEAAGWDDPSVGVVDWYGVYATGSARVAGRMVYGVKPVEALDGTGFYVSPTALEDRNYDHEDQRRYVDAVRVPHAVVTSRSGIELGSFGVAWRPTACEGGPCDPAPFLVADIGPRIGEGSIALARKAAGLAPITTVTQENRFDGAVSSQSVVWVFFGGTPASPPYDRATTQARALQSFEVWGGEDRLFRCLRGNIPTASPVE